MHAPSSTLKVSETLVDYNLPLPYITKTYVNASEYLWPLVIYATGDTRAPSA